MKWYKQDWIWTIIMFSLGGFGFMIASLATYNEIILWGSGCFLMGIGSGISIHKYFDELNKK